MKHIILILVLSWSVDTIAQDTELKWHEPVRSDISVIEGQAWSGEMTSPYDRLPARAEPLVRDAVQDLSKMSAGLMIRFRTNAENIKIRYQVENKDDLALNHMPATGVSGVDLYSIGTHGEELWCAAKRHWADTIVYTYGNLTIDTTYHQRGPEYRLYLPLYNQTNWLEIGIDDSKHFEFLPVRKEKPIVVYGTSIAQGACASRPGMAWTAILGRKMDRPLINLGFSGNGLLETPIVDLLTEIDAKVYVLDCLPNIVYRDDPEQMIRERLRSAVHQLRDKQPNTPILITDHAGYTDGHTNNGRKLTYELGNKVQRNVYDQLINEGVENLHYLTKAEIGLTLDDMVDGTHPTDLGMFHYAEGYERKLRSILNEEVGNVSTTRPVTQYREPDNYDWQERHREILDLNKTDPPKTIIIANSIIHFWGGEPKAPIVKDGRSWETVLTPAGVRNYAYGWDRIENVLWRVHHGELDGFDAEKILVMIGTNNMHLNTNEEIIKGLNSLVTAIKQRQTKAEIVLMGILPRRDYEQRITQLNMQIKAIANDQEVSFADLGHVFLADNDLVNESLFSDGLHPNKAGYQELIKVLEPLVK